MIKLLVATALVLSLNYSIVYADEIGHDFCHEHDCKHGIDFRNFFRMDCRFHNIEHHFGALFCYASAVYRLENNHFEDVHLGIGCDKGTVFYDKARIQMETTLDRFSPFLAATPGLEVFPQGQLGSVGTYTSVLDIALGRFQGLCYVHRMLEP